MEKEFLKQIIACKYRRKNFRAPDVPADWHIDLRIGENDKYGPGRKAL